MKPSARPVQSQPRLEGWAIETSLRYMSAPSSASGEVSCGSPGSAEPRLPTFSSSSKYWPP